MFAWDIKQVLDLVKEKFPDNDQLSNKEVTLKVITRSALTESSSILTLHILDLNHMIKKVNIMNPSLASSISLGEGEYLLLVKSLCASIR